MHKSFTIIEIIFVIIILSILSTISFIYFFKIADEAQEKVARAFAGTLYRTVGHSFWSKSLSVGKNGSIKDDDDGDNSKFFGKSLSVYTTIPKYFDENSVNFNNCVDPGQNAQPFIAKKSGVGEFNIFCRDGNTTNAPYFVASKNDTYQF